MNLCEPVVEPCRFHLGAYIRVCLMQHQQMVNLVLYSVRGTVFMNRTVWSGGVVALLLPLPLQERDGRAVPIGILRFACLLAERKTMMKFLDVGVRQAAITAHQVHHHLKGLSLVRDQCSGIAGNATLCMEIAQCLHPRFKNLNRDATVDRV